MPTGMAFTTLVVLLLLTLIASQHSSHSPTLLSILNLVFLIKAPGSLPTRLATLAHGISCRSPCSCHMKGKFISLRSVYEPDHWEVSAGHFNWHEYREGPPPLELFLVFGEDCLHLTTGNNNLASFDLPQRNSTPVPLTNNGWTLSPTTGAYFFARSSVSVGHLFPSAPATDDPFRLPRPNET